MFKSIRHKFFAISLLLVLFSFLTMNILLFEFFGDYMHKTQEVMLTGQIEKIAELTSLLSSSGYDQIYKKVLDINVENYSQSFGGYIVVFDADKRIVALTSEAQNEFYGKKLPQQLTDKILSGEKISHRGRFGDIFTKSIYIIVGRPVYYGQTVIGGIYGIMPVPMASAMKSDIFYLIITSTIFAFILASIFAFIIAKGMTGSLKKINEAARSFASGNFDVHLSIRNKDEIGQLAANFNEMADALKELEDMRKSFIANLTHEIRTPITIIVGFLEGILDGTIPSQKQNEYLTIVVEEMNRLSRLVNDLLDVARIETGGRQIAPQKYDVNEQIRLVLLRYENKITDKKLRVEVDFESDKCFVSADKDAIERVILNLLDNAVKFSEEEGNLRIKVETKGGRANVSVQNSGQSIAEEDLKHIWDRFYKSDKSRSMDKTGVGLGLYIVKSLIAQHKETIWATSTPDGMTTFTFTLEYIKK